MSVSDSLATHGAIQIYFDWSTECQKDMPITLTRSPLHHFRNILTIKWQQYIFVIHLFKIYLLTVGEDWFSVWQALGEDDRHYDVLEGWDGQDCSHLIANIVVLMPWHKTLKPAIIPTSYYYHHRHHHYCQSINTIIMQLSRVYGQYWTCTIVCSSVNLLLLVCVSWTITGQPGNTVFICRV